MAETGRTDRGLGRLLVLVYAVFALSATGRSSVQLVQKAGEAPLAYSLSALAAVVYVLATVCLARPGPIATRLAWLAVGVELVGVLVVGALTVADPALFPDDTVWSRFGSGYGYVPAVLRVRTRDGDRHEARVDVNRGGPGNPLTADELAAKFGMNAQRVLDDEARAQVAKEVLDLPDREDVAAVMRLVRG